MVIEFTPTASGTFEMICQVPGHKDAGMRGTVTIGDGKSPAGTAAQPAANVAPRATVEPARAAGPLPRPQIAPPLGRTQPATVKVDLETTEVVATLADGVTTTMWTFNGTVPGPMIRAMQGDIVEIWLRNNAQSEVTHSIDSHGVTGPGGGAQVTQTKPGGRTAFRFEALNPGVYVYHCATAPVAQHLANGMYGLMVIEPKGGLPKVDHEFYVMQGDFYLQGERNQQGHREYSMDKMLTEDPDYVAFSGYTGSLSGDHALKAKVGETVRIFFGVGGPNLTSSFHVIGEIFDRVNQEGASEPQTNIQTTLVPAGGATMVEFKLEVPGRYVLVDHSLGRLQKGNVGYLDVEGPPNPRVFEVIEGSGEAEYGH
ncbi:MAG: nitrite reductase, copper-containing [Chloroflexi bacterium]|nr:nitrite reductase, copper-containing [Chloroflexota bacterium]